MTPSVKMAAIVVALFFLACAQAGSATEEAVAVEDMVPVSASEHVHVTVAMPSSGVGTTLAAPVCLQCRCCPKSNPSQCVVTNCCSTFNCNPAGKCNLVQQKCGCGGCGGAN